jgi:trehalose synthase
MKVDLEAYAAITGPEVIEQLKRLAAPLKGLRIVHVNSTREGGGVAEILDRLVPLMQQLGLDASWEVIGGEPRFYQCTKGMHNALQGFPVNLGDDLLAAYEATNAQNAEILGPVLRLADVVFIHDPQPARMLHLIPDRKGKWVWRCHIDVSRPHRPVWRYLRDIVAGFDASIFSLADFAQPLPHPEYLVPPSIDPLSDKNIALPPEEIGEIASRFGIDLERPLVAQISRYDRFKDPVGVVQAWRLARTYIPGLQLVLAGGGALDDPEGEAVLSEVHTAAGDESDVHVLLLPPDAHRAINALQSAAGVVMQKSLREGFGLTVTEGLWKGRPVIGGDTGGIRLQVINHHTGFLVSTPEGAALRLEYLFHHEALRRDMGRKAKEFVRDNFLLTRHLRDYLTVIHGMLHSDAERLVLGDGP